MTNGTTWTKPHVHIFLNSVTDPDKMTEYFNDKIRFELKLNSVDRLRHCLKIESTSLFDVLYSQTDPIATVLDEVMEGNIYSSLRKQCPTMKSLLQLLLIAFCNYEATNVETVIRDYLPPKSSPTRQLEKFKPMLSELNKMQSFLLTAIHFDFLRSHLMSMLAACTVNDDTLTLNGIYKTNKIYHMKTTMNQNLFKVDNNNSIYIFKKIISEIIEEKLNQLNFETKDIFNVEEASKYLNLSKSTLYKLTSNKQIPHYKPTGKCIFFKSRA